MEERFPSEGAQGAAGQGSRAAASRAAAGTPPGEPQGSSTEIEQSVGEEVDGQLVAHDGGAPWGGEQRGSELVRTERSVPVTLLPAVAAGSFAAGAAVMTYVHRRRAVARPGAKRRSVLRRGGASEERLQIVGSRSLLLDVHLLGRGR